MHVFIANDHAGVQLKSQLTNHLMAKGIVIDDLGTQGEVSVDYPDFAFYLAKALKQSSKAYAIGLCGSGIGMSIAANRYHWVRAALVHDAISARLARQHNDANMLVLGARLITQEQAFECVDIFLTRNFEGGRHEIRTHKLFTPKTL